eukprot:5429020-Prymnesium_polylepis.1
MRSLSSTSEDCTVNSSAIFVSPRAPCFGTIRITCVAASPTAPQAQQLSASSIRARQGVRTFELQLIHECEEARVQSDKEPFVDLHLQQLEWLLRVRRPPAQLFGGCASTHALGERGVRFPLRLRRLPVARDGGQRVLRARLMLHLGALGGRLLGGRLRPSAEVLDERAVQDVRRRLPGVLAVVRVVASPPDQELAFPGPPALRDDLFSLEDDLSTYNFVALRASPHQAEVVELRIQLRAMFPYVGWLPYPPSV